MNEQDKAGMSARQGKATGNKTFLHDEVGEFCEDFAQEYKGWLVAVEEPDQNGQQRVIADGQPLQALSYQADDGHFDVRIVLGTNTGESFAHVVQDARSIDLQADDNGAAEELRIRSGSRVTTVRLRSPSKRGTNDTWR